jgi:signal transduction histidine kinase
LHGVANVIRTGKAELYPVVTEEMLRLGARDDEHLRVLLDLGIESVLIVPLPGRDRVLGAVTLIYAGSGRRYGEEDLEFVEEFARRAAMAIENGFALKQAEEAHTKEEALRRQADQANRTKDEFLALVSHELRTPLNAIVGWAQMLRGKDFDSATAKAIEVIHRNAQAQARIIDDILDVSRIVTGKLELDLRPIDLVAVVAQAVDVIRPSAEAKGITVEFMPEEVTCPMVGDPERLQQVAWNLLSNAIKFTGKGGLVRVTIERRGSAFIVNVIDSGAGMDKEFLPHAFQAFRQADASAGRRVGGLGLGLALVRHIVELHGGTVHADSAGLGRGATFSITLPVRALIPATNALQSAPSAPSLATPSASESLSGLRILVVDDDDDGRELIAQVLAGSGAIVATAASASEGFDAIRRSPPQILISDIGMPGEDGFSFIRRVRALGRTGGGAMPAIALTAYTRHEDRTKALAAGFTTHIGKPVNPDELVAAVANLKLYT